MTSKEETKEEKSGETEEGESVTSKKEQRKEEASERETTSNSLLDKQKGKADEDQVVDAKNENGDCDEAVRVKEEIIEEEIKETESTESEMKPKTPTRASKRKLNEAEAPNVDANKNEKESEESKTESRTDDESSDNPPKSISESDIMGKGKRARIPNKRYSEIAISNSRKSLGGNKTLETDLDITIKEEPLDSPTAVLSPQLSQPPPAKKTRVSSTGLDLQDPKYLKPFKYGWKRELVWRSTSSTTKRTGDIYYYTPKGEKVRSMRELAEHLDNRNLTTENFTYYKASLGVNDISKEVIRDAKVIRSDSNDVRRVSSPALKNTTKPTPKKVMSPKVMSPKIMSPKVVLTKVMSPKVNTPKVTINKKAEKKETPSKTPVSLAKKNNTKVVVKKSTAAAKPENKSPTAKTPVRKGRSANVPVKNEEPMELDSSSPSPVKLSPFKTKIAKLNNNVNKTRNLRGRKPVNSNVNHTDDTKPTETKFMDNYMQNLSFGYNTLLYVFQYLKVQDLLRAGCVCFMWRDIASHPILWKTVRMKNSQVHSFEGLANALKSHGTINLDLRKMLLPNGGDQVWPEFSAAIQKVDTLRKIELCRCPASVVEQLALTNPKLEVINAVTIKCEVMNFETLRNLTNIKELRLKATNGLNISTMDSLKELKSLKIFSLTSVNELHGLNLEVLGELTSLQQLDLGECTDFPKNFGKDIISKLKNLEKLRLEKGQGSCHTFEILDAIKDMPKLEQLELVNFDVKSGFDKALGACTNIKKLMIIPTYISQSATTNNMVLSGVLRLQGCLSHFVWGVTLELLRVTELFVDQCEEPKEKKEKKPTGNGDSIPVLKPVPDLTHGKEIPVACNPPQVEILPLPNLQTLLLNSLPTTRVKILKIPFHATWRQTLTDSV